MMKKKIGGKKNKVGKRAVFLIVMGGVFFLAAANLTALKVFFLILGVVVAVALADLWKTKKIRVVIKGPESGEKNQPLAIQINIMNEGFLPLEGLIATIRTENKITKEVNRQQWNLFLGGKAEKENTFYLEEKHCGCLIVAVETIKITGFLGWGTKEVTARGMENPWTISIGPQILEIPMEQNQWSTYDPESQRYSEIKPGDDPSEPFGIREYGPGDSVKQIHWKLLAKTGTAMIRQPGFPIEEDILLLGDKSLPPGAPFVGEKKAEETELFLSLSHSLIQKGIIHHMGWYDYERHQLKLEKISSEEALWKVAHWILAAPYQEDNYSTVYHLLESLEGKTFAQYIYVSREKRDLERLKPYGQVHTYNPKDVL